MFHRFLQSVCQSFVGFRKCRGAGGLFAVLVSAAMSPKVQAINIVIQLQDEGENPSYDSSGAQLQSMFNVAASFWEDYLPESETYEVDVSWNASEFSGDDDVLARWTYQAAGDNNIRVNPNPTSNGNPVQWFFDPTPFDHSEYDFVTQDRVLNSAGTDWIYQGGQWLYGDIDGDEKSAWFNGSPPTVMEVGYRGRAIDPTILNQYDLLSTVIHELGHELGINSPWGGPWQADPTWVIGGTAEIDDDPEDNGHLAARTSLMCAGCGLVGTRRLPSAVDIMAVADDEGKSIVDLPRQDYVGSGPWHTVFFPTPDIHWMGATTPDGGDDAYLRSNNTVFATANADVKNLWISNGSALQVQSGVQFQAYDSLTVSLDGGSSSLWVGTGATVNTDKLTLMGGNLQLLGGTVTVYDDLVITDDGVSGGEISASGGEVRVGGTLYNDGSIISFGGVTTFTHTGMPGQTLDLDGLTQNGLIRAHAGDLVFDAETTDALDGDMEILEGRTISMNYDWALGTAGLLKMFAIDPTDGPITLNGPAKTTIHGMATVSSFSTDDTAIGVLATDEVWFESSSIVQVDTNDRLVLDSDVFYRGGIHTGPGAIEQQGNVQVWDDTDILADEYDWGNSGTSQNHETRINEGVTFTIQSATTGTPDNEYRGVIHVTGGTLDVALDSGWLLPRRDGAKGLPAGTLILNRGDSHNSVVKGMPLTVEGFVRVHGGQALMEADFLTTPTADIEVEAATELLLKGKNTLHGGHLYGDGEIGQWGATTVASDTTIDTQYLDLDGDEAAPSITTIQPGVTFTINSQRIDKPAEFFDGTVLADGGTLAVNTLSSWTIGQNGTVHLMNNGGPAWILGSNVQVQGTIVATGGNEIFPAVKFTPTTVVSANQPGDILRLRGHTDYEGGVYSGGGGIIQDATAYVNAPTAINLGFFDMDGVSETNFIELHDDFYLNVDRIDMNENRFNGVLSVTDTLQLGVNTPQRWEMAGSMVVAGAPGTELTVSGAEVHFASDANVQPDNTIKFEADVSGPGNFTGGGDVEFLGSYSPGASPALVTFDGNLSLRDTSELWLELGGTVPGSDYDQLAVQADAFLSGVLHVSLLDDGMGSTYLPQIGDVFDLVTVSNSLVGEFAQVQLPQQVDGTGFDWDLRYGSQSVQLELVDIFEITLPGDFNGDGEVNGTDFLLWQRDPSIGDLADWKNGFGSGGEASLQAGQVPEPPTIAVALVALAICASLRSPTRPPVAAFCGCCSRVEL